MSKRSVRTGQGLLSAGKPDVLEGSPVALAYGSSKEARHPDMCVNLPEP